MRTFRYVAIALTLLTLSLINSSKITFAESVAPAESVVDVGPTSEKRVIRLTDKGLVPDSIVLHRQDGSVFFVNETPKSLLDVAVNFGPRRKHCWTKNMEVSNEGVIHTTKPLEPRDFALVCFPESGEYLVTVRGVPAKPQGLTAKVIVP